MIVTLRNLKALRENRARVAVCVYPSTQRARSPPRAPAGFVAARCELPCEHAHAALSVAIIYTIQAGKRGAARPAESC